MRQLPKCWIKTPQWVKRSELCLESKELQLLPYSRLSEWPSGYLLKHYCQVVRGAISGGGEPPPKDEKGLKGWIRNKLKALASLFGRLGMKAAEAQPGIIGEIISWILNRVKDVVGWELQNLWALVVGIGGLIYMYMVTRK